MPPTSTALISKTIRQEVQSTLPATVECTSSIVITAHRRGEPQLTIAKKCTAHATHSCHLLLAAANLRVIVAMGDTN